MDTHERVSVAKVVSEGFFVLYFTHCLFPFFCTKLLVKNTEMRKCCGNLSHIKNAFTNAHKLEKLGAKRDYLVQGYHMGGMLAVQVDVIAAAHKAMLGGFETYVEKLKDTPGMVAISTLFDLYMGGETQTAVYLGSDIVAYSVCCIGGSFTRDKDAGYEEVDKELLAKDERGVYMQRYKDCRIVPKDEVSAKDVLNICTVLDRINQKVYPKGDVEAEENKKILDNVAGVGPAQFQQLPWRFTDEDLLLSRARHQSGQKKAEKSKVQSRPRAHRTPAKPKNPPSEDSKSAAKLPKEDSKPAAKPSTTLAAKSNKKISPASAKMPMPPKPSTRADDKGEEEEEEEEEEATADEGEEDFVPELDEMGREYPTPPRNLRPRSSCYYDLGTSDSDSVYSSVKTSNDGEDDDEAEEEEGDDGGKKGREEEEEAADDEEDEEGEDTGEQSSGDDDSLGVQLRIGQVAPAARDEEVVAVECVTDEESEYLCFCQHCFSCLFSN